MKFLVDNNLSPTFARLLTEAGHDTVHVRDYGMTATSDDQVLSRAKAEDRVLVSADTDFGALLAASGAARPSVPLVRRLVGRRATDMAAIILANLDQIADDLSRGAVVVIGDNSLRIRPLPILPHVGSA
jgi:predicted nuclease of predicted toxin-antitoxin system